AADPAVRDAIFHGEWRTVDYLIMLRDLEKDFNATKNIVAIEALRHAHLVKRWNADDNQVELWKVDKPGATEAALLANSAAAITRRFGHDGAYADADRVVTSEAQAYAMLRAVWGGDRAG